MNNLRAIIGEEVGRKSIISFERFMELALYCPDFGYYERSNATPGRRGDFFTSVSVGPLFGELLAGRFAEWLGSGQNASRQIVEAGAHDGQLASDILNWLRAQRPDVFEAVEYWILEPSALRKELQEDRLKEFIGKVRWFENWEALPAAGVQGVIFSNELLDAMPVRRLGWDAGQKKWFEWGVRSSGEEFAWARMPGVDGLEAVTASWHLPPQLLEVLPDGFTTELGGAAIGWWQRAARYLQKGKLLALDYGLEQEEYFTPERKEGTLRAYYRHHLNADLLARPGEQDITAQVNFSAMRQTGEAEGLQTECFTTQAEFLTDIVREITAKNPDYEKWISEHARAFQTLTHPEHLGRSFRVLVQRRD